MPSQEKLAVFGLSKKSASTTTSNVDLIFFTFPTGYKTLRQRERIIMSGRK